VPFRGLKKDETAARGPQFMGKIEATTAAH
jgi:hypothetical protein